MLRETEATLTDQIHALEAKVASILETAEPSPEAGMNTMKKALAEAEIIGLKHRRKRLRKPSRREDAEGAKCKESDAEQEERERVADNTTRLRAQRLAKEEADRVVAEQSPKPPPKKKSVKPAVKKAR